MLFRSVVGVVAAVAAVAPPPLALSPLRRVAEPAAAAGLSKAPPQPPVNSGVAPDAEAEDR